MRVNTHPPALKGICNGTTVPHSPRQKGVAERMKRTLQEAALSRILHARLNKVSGQKQFASQFV